MRDDWDTYGPWLKAERDRLAGEQQILLAALRKIAAEDYRGTKPHSIYLAEAALRMISKYEIKANHPLTAAG